MIKRLKFMVLTLFCIIFAIAGTMTFNNSVCYVLAVIGWFVGLFFILRAEYNAQKVDRELKKRLLEEKRNNDNK